MKEYFLLVVLPNLSNFFCIVSCLMFILFMITFLCTLEDKSRDNEETINYKRKLSKQAFWLLLMPAIIFVFSSNFIPSKKEFLQLQAIKIFKETKGIEQIPQKLIDKVNNLLDIEDK